MLREKRVRPPMNWKCLLASTAVASCTLLTGCEVMLNGEVRQFAEKAVNECEGKVNDIAIVKSSGGGSGYEGMAEVTIENEEYKLAMSIKSGPGGTIIETSDNPCIEHKIKKGIRSFFGN